MVTLAQTLIDETHNSQLGGGAFNFATPIEDPLRNVTFAATLPETVAQLTRLFNSPTNANVEILRYNYEGLHRNLSDFVEQRREFYSEERGKHSKLMTALLVVYELLLGIVALAAIPLFAYFKGE